MPTRVGMASLIIAGALVIAGRVFGIFELYLVSAAIAALVACAMVWVLANRRSLQVDRAVRPARLHAGGESTVTLELSNRRLLPTPVARITDQVSGETRADANVPPMRRNRVTRASYRVPTERRGLIDIGPMQTTIADPFGLASSRATRAADARLLVLPHVDPIVAPPLPAGRLAHKPDRTPSRIGLSGDEFSSLREYAVGDDLRKVNWAATARTGDLMVRTEEYPEHGISLVGLDTRTGAASPEVFERMVSATASVLTACHERGDEIALALTNGTFMTADSRRDYDRILDALALVEQAGRRLDLSPELLDAPTSAAVLVVAEQQADFVERLWRRVDGTRITVDFSDRRAASDRRRDARAVHTISVRPDTTFPVAWDTMVRNLR